MLTGNYRQRVCSKGRTGKVCGKVHSLFRYSAVREFESEMSRGQMRRGTDNQKDKLNHLYLASRCGISSSYDQQKGFLCRFTQKNLEWSFGFRVGTRRNPTFTDRGRGQYAIFLYNRKKKRSSGSALKFENQRFSSKDLFCLLLVVIDAISVLIHLDDIKFHMKSTLFFATRSTEMVFPV